MAENQNTSTGNPLLDIIETVKDAEPMPAPSTKPSPAGSAGISKPAGTIKVNLQKFIGGGKK